MILIHSALTPPPQLPPIALHADRLALAKRRWRAIAEDGCEFGFDLATPLTHGDTFFATQAACYTIEQIPEPVLEITLIPKPAAVARLGWTIGNLHFPIQVTADSIRVPDDPALRALFARQNIPFILTQAIFVPFAQAHSHE